jgi:hypothetical protein
VARNTTRQGADFELDVMHYLAGTQPERWGDGFGYDCLRSSGSRGTIDIVAVGSETLRSLDSLFGRPEIKGPLLFIQCKITNPQISPADRRRVQDLATRAGAVPLVAYREKDTETGRVRPHFRLLTGPGPKDWLPWEPERNET